MEYGYFLSCIYRISAQTDPRLIANVQVVGTSQGEIVPGDAMKSLSQRYLSIPDYIELREGGEGK